MLALASERFIKGSGDSGNHGLKTETERSVAEAVRECIEWNGIACAAHPMEHNTLLERVLLARGKWTLHDLETPGLTALQIHNGLRDRGFRDGMKAWIRLLLKGRRIHAFGGSDAHGDMNRRRRIVMPLVAMGEDISHTLGSVRTVVKTSSQHPDHIIEGLKNGRVMVSEGPFIDLTVSVNGTSAGIGGSITGSEGAVRALFKSSSEFGYLKSGRILAGMKGESKERILVSFDNSSMELERRIEKFEQVKDFRYIRAECETVLGKYCFTNPVWVEDGSS
jgi:hypothetical protein